MEDEGIGQAVGRVHSRVADSFEPDVKDFRCGWVADGAAGAVVAALLGVQDAVPERAEVDGRAIVQQVEAEEGEGGDDRGGDGADDKTDGSGKDEEGAEPERRRLVLGRHWLWCGLGSVHIHLDDTTDASHG